jgi:L-threonylcarbamoyladenylate synthase
MSTTKLQAQDAVRLAECIAQGGIAVFPTDTVYGLCCDPEDETAARRLYALKGRPRRRASAVMFFSLGPALEALVELRDGERAALQALLPGAVTVLLGNPARRFSGACRKDPGTLGLRVPRLSERLSALAAVTRPVMQSSANLSGETDAKALEEIPRSILEGADLVLDGGELPGTPSTVVDLRDFESERRWYILREGAIQRGAVQGVLEELG